MLSSLTLVETLFWGSTQCYSGFHYNERMSWVGGSPLETTYNDMLKVVRSLNTPLKGKGVGKNNNQLHGAGHGVQMNNEMKRKIFVK